MKERAVIAASLVALAVAAGLHAFAWVGRLIRESYPPVASEAERSASATPAWRGFAPAEPAPAPDLIPVPAVVPAPIITPAPFPVPSSAPPPEVRTVMKTVTVEVPPPGLIAERDVLKARIEAAEAKLARAAELGRAQLVAEQARSKAFQFDLERENATLRQRITDLCNPPSPYPGHYVRTGP